MVAAGQRLKTASVRAGITSIVAIGKSRTSGTIGYSAKSESPAPEEQSF
jgi:hypothetical protein